MANSTNSVPLFLVFTLASYCSGLIICSSNAPNWTSPNVPRIFTLLNTFFSPPTSCARDFISPSPFCTFSSCERTISKDCPMRSFNVFCNFSSTISRISSSRFSVDFIKTSCWRAIVSNFWRCSSPFVIMFLCSTSCNCCIFWFSVWVISMRSSRILRFSSSRFSCICWRKAACNCSACAWLFPFASDSTIEITANAAITISRISSINKSEFRFRFQ